MIENKANVNMPNEDPCSGFCALHNAVQQKHLEMAKLLYAQGACTHNVLAPLARVTSLPVAIQRVVSADMIAVMCAWVRSVETPPVLKCEKCGFDVSEEGKQRDAESSVRRHAKEKEYQQRCCNPKCPCADDLTRLRLKKCGRCLQAAYCRFVTARCRVDSFVIVCSASCQREHWPTHKRVCNKPPAA